MKKSVLTAMIIDDEWWVREELKTLLSAFPQVKVLGEAADVLQAIESIKRLKPDVLFLDIQMPGASGFDLLEQVDTDADIIFITAYDQYALKAFEVNALDYLLKPIQKGRLQKAIERLFAHPRQEHKTVQKLQVDDLVYLLINGAVKFVKVNLIKCIVAEGNYSYIFYKDRKKELVTKTLQEWESILPETHFLRIHRSTIVNLDYVEEIKRCKNYSQLVYIRDLEKPLVMSRRYAAKLKKLIS